MAAQYSRYATYIEPLVKTKKSKAYTMLALSLFTIAFFGYFAIRPTLLTVVSLQQEISQSKNIDEKLAAKIEALDKANRLLDTYRDKQFLLREAMPQSPNIAQLMSVIERKASESRVQVGNLQVRSISLTGEEMSIAATTSANLTQAVVDTNKPANTAPQEIKFQFNVIGSDTAIINFIKQLNETRRIVVVDNVAIRTKEGSGSFTAELSAKAYQYNF